MPNREKTYGTFRCSVVFANHDTLALKSTTFIPFGMIDLSTLLMHYLLYFCEMYLESSEREAMRSEK